MNENRNRGIWLVLSILIIGTAAWAFAHYSNRPETGPEDAVSMPDAATGGQSVGEGQTVSDIDASTKLYANTVLGISFDYVAGYTLSTFGNYYDSTGQTILLQKNADGGTEQGLQVLVTPFDEDISLTAARIKKDLPAVAMSNVSETTLDAEGGKVAAVVFDSANASSMGQSHEAWFVWNGNLYQISAPQDSAGLFEKVKNTWRFQQ
jgi:hypothetical protein